MLDRDELAARFAVALTRDHGDCQILAKIAVTHADALLAALAPAEVATPCCHTEAHPGRTCAEYNASPPAPAPVAERPTYVDAASICVDLQGVSFGPHCWISHDAISGCVYGTEEQRRAFYRDRITAKQYMEWVNARIAQQTAPPCPPPPPADARGEAYKALLAYAECDNAYCYSDGAAWKGTLKRHGWDESENSGDWLRSLCERALSLARKAEGGAA